MENISKKPTDNQASRLGETINSTERSARFVIVGGGIAGTSCIEELCFHCPNEPIILITDSDDIKTTTNVKQIARTLSNFDVERRDVSTLPSNVQVIIDRLDQIDSMEKCVKTTINKYHIKYDYLCLCTGAKPKLIDHVNVENRKYILGLRDTESVVEFEKRVHNSRKILIVGNGGIASDLVYQLTNIEIEWVIKDKYVSQTFLDAGAATFFKKSLSSSNNVPVDMTKRLHFNENSATSNELEQADSFNTSSLAQIAGTREAPVLTGFHHENILHEGKYPPTLATSQLGSISNPTHHSHKTTLESGGSALGPNWHKLYNLSGQQQQGDLPTTVNIHYETEIQTISINSSSSAEFPVQVKLQNGTTIACDFIVSATGVTPNLEFCVTPEPFVLGHDGGIRVNEFMESSIANIYAAGDCCTAGWQWSKWWFQMRLWTQARQMGLMAGKSMAFKLYNEEIYQDFCFELFGHVTQLYGAKVILLGLFNGQGLTDPTGYVRINPGEEYIKLVCDDKKIHGALLVGESDLAEAAENLILDQFDVSSYRETILEPEFDLTEYYD